MEALLRFARRYLGRYLPWYAAGSVALVVTNWLSVTIPLYLASGIDALALGAQGVDTVWWSALMVGGMGLAIIGVRTLSRVLFFTPGRLVEAEIKHDLFDRLLRQQPAFLRQWPTGDLISRASSDVTFLRLLAGYASLALVNITTALILTGGQMYRLSPTLTGYVVLPVAIGLFVTLFFLRQLFQLTRQMQAETAELSDFILSSYQGKASIEGFVAQPRFVEVFAGKNRQLLATTLRRANIRTVIGPTLSLAAAINVFVLLYVGGPMAIEGTLSVGELVAFTTLVAYLTLPLRSLSFLLTMLRQAEAALERIEAVMEPAPDRPDLPDPAPAPSAPPALSLQGLSFAYPDAPDDVVLHDISLDVPAGSTVGLLGLTGSGKTTLLRCLARLYNPPAGTVFVDGTDIRDIDLDGWRRALSFVPQRAFLFSESLRDNVLLGAPDDGRLEDVLARAALGPDVEALPDGVATEVGEKGVMLSGGQRQRVALARGLVRPHHVLALDDVLSAVDHATEHELIETLKSTGSSPTTFIVSHRVSALQHADQIAVLDAGRLVDCGTHAELVARDGLYRETYERQLAENGA